MTDIYVGIVRQRRKQAWHRRYAMQYRNSLNSEIQNGINLLKKDNSESMLIEKLSKINLSIQVLKTCIGKINAVRKMIQVLKTF